MRANPAGLAFIAALIASTVFATACNGSSTTPGSGQIASVQIASGNAQRGFAGEELPEALVVRVTDSAGAPVAGQIVNFRVTEGGGSVFAGAAASDAGGMARERWTLGPVTGPRPFPRSSRSGPWTLRPALPSSSRPSRRPQSLGRRRTSPTLQALRHTLFSRRSTQTPRAAVAVPYFCIRSRRHCRQAWR